MTHTFAAGIGPLERGVENIGHVSERIAVASAPDVLRMLNGFQDVTHGWEQDTRNAADLQHSVHGTVQEFGDWFDLATSLGHLLSALFLTNEQGARRREARRSRPSRTSSTSGRGGSSTTTTTSTASSGS
jgi:hypothetical protein